ncbi:MAG: NifU family protein [Bradyrhizobiaceae bacterium]|nr:NifU family protein [Bradyrhizobiaceae bacterium]
MNAIDVVPGQPSDLAGLLGDIEGIETIVANWESGQRNTAQAYRRAIEALHGEALRRLIRALKTDPAAFAAVKAAVADEIVYAVLRRHGIIRASLGERVEAALTSIRPVLASHGGDVELVKIAPPAIEVRFLGACDGCAASMLTFHAGVKKAVMDACPEITEVIQIKGTSGTAAAGHVVSPFAGGTWLAAGTLEDIPEGGVRRFGAGGVDVLLFRRGTAVTCFEDACSHLGLGLGGGTIADGVITCPHHGFRYDLATGACLTAPVVRLRSLEVHVSGDKVEIRLAG